MITCYTALIFLMTIGSLAASPATETPAAKELWRKANVIADASSTYLPSERHITYQELDGKGNVIYSDQALVLIESSHHGRYLKIHKFGDEGIFSLINRYSDGFIMTPFEDEIEELEYKFTGITEKVGGKTSDVFTFEIAYDANLPYYDPNYKESGKIINWDFDEDDFEGIIDGTIWLDQITGAPVKMTINYLFEDNTQNGTLNLSQTVYFNYTDGIITPATIKSTGTLSIYAGQKGQLLVKDFVIEEEQLSFWENVKFARGSTVI